MRKSRFMVVGLALAFAFTLGLDAQLAQAQESPAEIPPASFTGTQFIDSRGCVFIRSGMGENVAWLPRLSGDRTQLCGFQPTAIPEAMIAEIEEPATEEPVADTLAAEEPPVEEEAAETPVAEAPVAEGPVIINPVEEPSVATSENEQPTARAPTFTDGNAANMPGSKEGPVAVPTPAPVPRAIPQAEPRVARPAQTRPAQTRPAQTRPVQSRPAVQHSMVQVGAYANQTNVANVTAQLAGLGLPVLWATQTRRDGTQLRLVAVGPFATPAELDAALQTVRRAGYRDAFTR